MDPEQSIRNTSYHTIVTTICFPMRPRTSTYYLLHPGLLCQVMPNAADMVPLLACTGVRSAGRTSVGFGKRFSRCEPLFINFIYLIVQRMYACAAYRTLYRHVPYPRVAAAHAALCRPPRLYGTMSDSAARED